MTSAASAQKRSEMKRATARLTIAIVWILATKICLAQTDTTDRSVDLRSPILAGYKEWTLPFSGYAYGGDWRKGIVPNILRIGGVAAICVGVAGERLNPVTFTTGFAVGGVGTIWAVTGAVMVTKHRNALINSNGAEIKLSLGVNSSQLLSIGMSS